MILKLTQSDLDLPNLGEIGLRACRAIGEVVLLGDSDMIYAAVDKLPDFWKAIYYADSLDAKVSNSGYYGYFADRGDFELDEVVEAVGRIGDEFIVESLRKAVDIFHEVEEIELLLYPLEEREYGFPDPPKIEGWKDMLRKTNDLKKQWEPLTIAYYDHQPCMLECIGQFILANSERFL